MPAKNTDGNEKRHKIKKRENDDSYYVEKYLESCVEVKHVTAARLKILKFFLQIKAQHSLTENKQLENNKMHTLK